ncbi:MAG: CPBP family intramembrane metalloprotease [Lewinellaceae bacterium]|nr:CPBP family intramembrane metalloprotease [Lewinellaceae bacterium]
MKKSVRDILQFKSEDIHYYIVLLSAPVLITLYRYLSMSENYRNYFPSLNADAEGIVISYKLQFVGFFVLMFILPLLHIAFWWKKPLEAFGFGLGDKRYGFRFLLLSFIFLVLPFAIGGSYDPSVNAEYPMAKPILDHHNFIVFYHLFYVAFYYIAWEFYFRGYILFGLKDRYGAMEAILLQTISSCLIHIDKPFAEILLSIPVAIFLGYIALRTKSFWYVFLVHASLGVITDLLIIYYQQ